MRHGFELSPNSSGGWTETVLYAFGGGTDGQNPEGDLIFDKNGALYGSTVVGGNSNSCTDCGTVFRLTPPSRQGGTWTEQVLYRFNNFSGGFWPEAGVVSDKAGALYGTTNEGGQGSNYCSDGCGVVFKLAPPLKPGGAWTKTVIYRFTGEGDGAQPYAGVTFDRTGNLVRHDEHRSPQPGRGLQAHAVDCEEWGLDRDHALHLRNRARPRVPDGGRDFRQGGEHLRHE